MNPIENAKYSWDFQKFVLQDPNIRVVPHDEHGVKPFKIDGPKKTDKSENEKKKKQDDQDPKDQKPFR